MKTLPLIAAAVALLAAAVLVYNGLPGVAVSVALPAILLALAALRGWPRTQLVAQMLLVAELVWLGLIWPSYFTIGALLALPAIPIAVWCAIRHRPSSLSEYYLRASALLAAACLLWEAVFLASL